MSRNYTIFAVNLLKLIANMRLKNETTHTVVHPETGEFIEETTVKTFSIKTSSEGFYFTFFTLLKEYIGLTDTAKNVLAVLCTEIKYNENCIKLNPSTRERICTLCDIKYQTLANTLQYLKTKKVININKGDCYINPEYFWKGDLRTRDLALENNKMTLNIEFES